MTTDRAILRNAPCPCGSGRRYKHCCGDADRGNSGRSAAPSLAPVGPPNFRTRKTFVVLGCPRGGTSLLAGALHHAGVYMGEFATTQYEDPGFKIPPAQASGAAARLAPTIRARNERFEYWGWKVPNNIYYIRNVVQLLVNPVFLFVYRDPLAIAKSSARHDGRNWDVERPLLLQVAVEHTARVRQFQQALGANGHAFQLEAIHADPVAFADRFIDLVAPLPVDRTRLLGFVDPNGGYH